MFHLPNEIISKIYSYDNTYKEKFNEVLDEMRNIQKILSKWIDYQLEDEYEVLTKEETEEKIKEWILEHLFYFTAKYLSFYTKISESAINKLQEYLDELDINNILINCINDKERFIEEAINVDGEEHFLLNIYESVEQVEFRDKLYWICN